MGRRQDWKRKPLGGGGGKLEFTMMDCFSIKRKMDLQRMNREFKIDESGKCRDEKNTENLDEAGSPNFEQQSSSLLLSFVSPQVEHKN